MYQAFEAIVSRGKIQPLEKIRLKESTRVLVTIVGDSEYPDTNWKRLKKWLTKERKLGKLSSYSSIDSAKTHLHSILKK